MKEILDYKEESESISSKEIFTKIWITPRRVFKFINDNHYDKYVTILLIFAGISRAFDRASLKNFGDKWSLETIIGVCVIAGALFGWLTFYIYAALVNWTGKWLKSAGNTKSLLNMFAYAMLPSIIALVFLIPQIAIYGVEMFKSDGDIVSAGISYNIFFYGSILLEGVLAIWTLIFFVVGTSEVQKLSIGRSILNLLLPIVVILVPLLFIALLFRL